MFHRLLPAEAQANVELSAFARKTLQPGTTKNILMMPKVCGLCNQSTWIPGFCPGHMGATCELHLAKGDEVLQSGPNQNTTYSLSNVRVLSDIYHLASDLQNKLQFPCVIRASFGNPDQDPR